MLVIKYSIFEKSAFMINDSKIYLIYAIFNEFDVSV